jgi:hypothetical protein
MRLHVCLSASDFESILHWYYIFKKSKEPTVKDANTATKLEALFISEREDDAKDLDRIERMRFGHS